MAKSEGARIRPSGIRHTTTPFIWGVDNDLQPQLGHSLEYVIAMVPQEGMKFLKHLLLIIVIALLL